MNGQDSIRGMAAGAAAADIDPVFTKTTHFSHRQQQRSISDRRVWLALNWGQPFHQGAEKVFFLGRKQLRRARLSLGAALTPAEADRADGTVVVVGADNALVTTYRNPEYIRHLRRCAA